MAESQLQTRAAVILTALPVEYRAVRAHLSNVQEKVHPSGTVYETGDFTPKDGQRWTVSIGEIGAGNEGAALEAERAINYFEAKVALFVGVAGGLKDVAIGDVVGGLQNLRLRVRQGQTLLRAAAVCGRVLSPAYSEGARRSQALGLAGALVPGLRPHASRRCGSDRGRGEGHRLVPRLVYRFIRLHYGDALAVEMEGRGFLKAAHANGEVHALVIRGISDLIEGKSKADARGSQELASRRASAFAFELLSKLRLPSTIRYRVEFEEA